MKDTSVKIFKLNKSKQFISPITREATQPEYSNLAIEEPAQGEQKDNI